MSMKQGESSYAGRILRVDLNTGEINSEPLRTDWARDFVGGKGLAYRYLFEELAPRTDPLSPENVLLIFSGPLAGTIVATTSRTVVVTKSPATGTILDTYVGGAFASELKYAGYDGIIVTGKAISPVYLFVSDKRVELCDARHLWGKGIFDTDSALKGATQEQMLRTLGVGPAGENLVPFACLTTDAAHQAGRGGAGAVFGSKNLKAIAVRGRKSVSVPDMESFLRLYRRIWHEELVTDSNLWAWRVGTMATVNKSNAAGILPTRGFTEGVFEAVSGIDGDAVKRHWVRNRACFVCPLACGKLTKVGDAQVEGPEYETLAMAGSNCGIGDLAAVIVFNRLCDDLGLDTISAGNVVGLAMAITEEGIADLGLRYGEVETYIQAVRDIAYRSGRWAELADGARVLAHKYGAENLLMESKGLEFPGYDPRGTYGMALAYATALRGGCHMPAFVVSEEAFGGLDPFTFEGKAGLVKPLQDWTSAKWSTICCDFWGVSPETLTKLLNAATGENRTTADLFKAGERIWVLGKLFNLREGVGRAADHPSAAIFERTLPSGPAAERRIDREDYENSLSEYYHLRGWDTEGWPTAEKLDELGLTKLAAQARGAIAP